MKARFNRSAAGFTMLEMMIAAFIMVFALGSSLVAVNSAMRRVATSRNQMAAMHTARVQLEELSGIGFDSSALDSGSHSFSQGEHSGSYTVSVETFYVKDVALTVTYEDILANSTRQVQIDTTLTRSLH